MPTKRCFEKCGRCLSTPAVKKMSSIAILPALQTLPLADDAKELFGRAIRLIQTTPREFSEVGLWLDRWYSEAAVYGRLLPEKRSAWNSDRADLTSAPVKGEMEWFSNPNKNNGNERNGWCPQHASTFREHLAQHRKARAIQHPGYELAMRQRRARLRELKAEQQNWRPTLKDRLLVAVKDAIEAEYPQPLEEHAEHSRQIVGIASLLVWPEPLPILGELGQWEWSSEFVKPEDSADWLTKMLSMDPIAAKNHPHRLFPTAINPRTLGRCEVMLYRSPGEGFRVNDGFPLDKFSALLVSATEELETVHLSKQSDNKWLGLAKHFLEHPLGSKIGFSALATMFNFVRSLFIGW